MSSVKITGYRFKSGKLEKVSTARNASQRIREKKSKKVRVVKKGSL